MKCYYETNSIIGSVLQTLQTSWHTCIFPKYLYTPSSWMLIQVEIWIFLSITRTSNSRINPFKREVFWCRRTGSCTWIAVQYILVPLKVALSYKHIPMTCRSLRPVFTLARSDVVSPDLKASFIEWFGVKVTI